MVLIWYRFPHFSASLLCHHARAASIYTALPSGASSELILCFFWSIRRCLSHCRIISSNVRAFKCTQMYPHDGRLSSWMAHDPAVLTGDKAFHQLSGNKFYPYQQSKCLLKETNQHGRLSANPLCSSEIYLWEMPPNCFFFHPFCLFLFSLL